MLNFKTTWTKSSRNETLTATWLESHVIDLNINITENLSWTLHFMVYVLK